MKKIALMLSLFVISTGISSAYLYSGELSNVDTLREQGFSESTLQVVNTVSFHNKGKHRDEQRMILPMRSRNPFGRAYTAVKNYIDPAQDDGLFGEHQIEYTNTWNSDLPGYARKYTENKMFENL